MSRNNMRDIPDVYGVVIRRDKNQVVQVDFGCVGDVVDSRDVDWGIVAWFGLELCGQ